jgi:hypothetical protein
MADHQIAPGAFVTNIAFNPAFDSTAATPSLDMTDPSDPFNWRVVTGAKPGGKPAMSASFTFVPKGVPNGFLFGVKQLAFHRGETSTYQGLPDNGSIVAGSTGVNSIWLLDVNAFLSATVFKADTFPFLSANPVAVGNGTQGRIDVSDSPGGTQRLIRTNLVTNKRNFLQSHGSAINFVTFLAVVKPDGAHLALEGFAWTVEQKAEVVWLVGKPTLRPSGSASFQNNLGREDIKGDRLQLLEDNSLKPQDTIAFKFNNSKILVEERDALTPPRTSGPASDVIISEFGYEITHAAKDLPPSPIK